MKQQLCPLLCACALVLASSLSVLCVAGAEGPAVRAKRQQAPVKRVRSAESSIEPVTNAAKKLARSLQEQIGAGLTKQKLLAINKPKNKKNALGKGAKFAINDAKADGKSPVGGRVLTSSGDLYVTYLPTAQGVIGVIEASTRLPTNSKADKTLRIELDVVGFRLNKVVEFYQFAFWPQRPSETLAAVVSRPPEFVSNGISPQQATKLLATRKKNAKSMTDAAIQATENKDTPDVFESLSWKCGTGTTPPVQNPPGTGDGSTPSTCNSTKEELMNCQGVVLCACPAPGMSGGGCCCQPVPKSEEVIKLPEAVPGKDGTLITVPEIPGLQPPAAVPGKDETRITAPEIPSLQPPTVIPGADPSTSDDNKIALPDSTGVFPVTDISNTTALKMMDLVNVLDPTGANDNLSIERLPIEELSKVASGSGVVAIAPLVKLTSKSANYDGLRIELPMEEQSVQPGDNLAVFVSRGEEAFLVPISKNKRFSSQQPGFLSAGIRLSDPNGGAPIVLSVVKANKIEKPNESLPLPQSTSKKGLSTMSDPNGGATIVLGIEKMNKIKKPNKSRPLPQSTSKKGRSTIGIAQVAAVPSGASSSIPPLKCVPEDTPTAAPVCPSPSNSPSPSMDPYTLEYDDGGSRMVGDEHYYQNLCQREHEYDKWARLGTSPEVIERWRREDTRISLFYLNYEWGTDSHGIPLGKTCSGTGGADRNICCARNGALNMFGD
jgi:hypothetical protein